MHTVSVLFETVVPIVYNNSHLLVHKSFNPIARRSPSGELQTSLPMHWPTESLLPLNFTTEI